MCAFLHGRKDILEKPLLDRLVGMSYGICSSASSIRGSCLINAHLVWARGGPNGVNCSRRNCMTVSTRPSSPRRCFKKCRIYALRSGVTAAARAGLQRRSIRWPDFSNAGIVENQCVEPLRPGSVIIGILRGSRRPVTARKFRCGRKRLRVRSSNCCRRSLITPFVAGIFVLLTISCKRLKPGMRGRKSCTCRGK